MARRKPVKAGLLYENVTNVTQISQSVVSGKWAFHSPSCPELRRCSPRSQPKTLSRRMPLCFSFCLVGLDFMKERKKVISFPCFLDTWGKAQGKRAGCTLGFTQAGEATGIVGWTQDRLSHVYLCTRLKPQTSCSQFVPLCNSAAF